MAITVTAAQGGSTFTGIFLRVVVLTGTAATQNGATATFQGTGPQEASITTTVTGSQVFGALKTSSTTSLTAASGTTIVDNIVDNANGEVFGSCRTTSLTGTPGATTVGASAPSVAGQTALLEVLPSGTLTIDGSSPASNSTFAATTISVGPFTPPSGSLLVAIVSSDATAATTITVSDDNGLTWTQAVSSESTSPTGYAGVWLAPFGATNAPAGNAPGTGAGANPASSVRIGMTIRGS